MSLRPELPWPASPSHRDLGGVALRIANHAAEDPSKWRREYRYSPRAAIEKVCFRRESVATSGDGYSYLWCQFVLDEDGALAPKIDLGRLATVWEHGTGGRRLRVSAPRERCDFAGPWGLIASDYVCVGEVDDEWSVAGYHWLLRWGLAAGQPFLVAFSARWYRCSYEYDEYDCDYDLELLYVAPPPKVALLPVPTDPSQWSYRGLD